MQLSKVYDKQSTDWKKKLQRKITKEKIKANDSKFILLYFIMLFGFFI